MKYQKIILIVDNIFSLLKYMLLLNLLISLLRKLNNNFLNNSNL